MSAICTICARAGSKGVKNKNIRLLSGKPLIAHSILQAKESGLFAAIAISSDSEEILNVAKQFGADILIQRRPEMATDTAAKLPVIRDCFLQAEQQLGQKFEFDVDLDCTSPLRSVNDILESFAMYKASPDAHNLITGSLARRSPYFNLVKRTQGHFVKLAADEKIKIERRQDAPVCFDMNASIYIWRREALLIDTPVVNERTILYEMPEERSVDIDTELDFKMVEFLMSHQKEA